jgi:hypothetical protein
MAGDNTPVQASPQAPPMLAAAVAFGRILRVLGCAQVRTG